MMFRFLLLLTVAVCACAFTMKMAAEGMSKSVPFLKKNANLEGMIVSCP